METWAGATPNRRHRPKHTRAHQRRRTRMIRNVCDEKGAGTTLRAGVRCTARTAARRRQGQVVLGYGKLDRRGLARFEENFVEPDQGSQRRAIDTGPARSQPRKENKNGVSPAVALSTPEKFARVALVVKEAPLLFAPRTMVNGTATVRRTLAARQTPTRCARPPRSLCCALAPGPCARRRRVAKRG